METEQDRMIHLVKHTINLRTGDVGVMILQGGSTENPIPVFANYKRAKRQTRSYVLCIPCLERYVCLFRSSCASSDDELCTPPKYSR